MPSGVYERTQEFIDKYLSHIKRIGLSNKGKKHSEEFCRKTSESHLGLIEPHRGKPWSKARILAQKPKKPIIFRGKEYSENWCVIRKQIYERDNWTCQECGNKCHNIAQRKIQCHHIDYNEKNNDFNNLITLCASCHMKTNFSREDWVNYFSERRNNGQN